MAQRYYKTNSGQASRENLNLDSTRTLEDRLKASILMKANQQLEKRTAMIDTTISFIMFLNSTKYFRKKIYIHAEQKHHALFLNHKQWDHNSSLWRIEALQTDACLTSHLKVTTQGDRVSRYPQVKSIIFIPKYEKRTYLKKHPFWATNSGIKRELKSEANIQVPRFKWHKNWTLNMYLNCEESLFRPSRHSEQKAGGMNID